MEATTAAPGSVTPIDEAPGAAHPDPDPASDAEAIAAANATPDADPEPDADLEGESETEQAVPDLVIEASGQLGLKIGGRKPDAAQVKLRGGSIDLRQGQFEKGEYANILCKVRCAEVHLVDKIDRSTGDVTDTIRRHILKIEHVEKVGG